MSADDREFRQQVGWCYEILPPTRDSSHDNPSLNMPKPLPPHVHDNGYDSRCGLCQYLAELSRERGR